MTRGIRTVPVAAALALLAFPATSQVERAWVRHYDGPWGMEDSSTDLDLDSAGNVYVAGHSRGIGSPIDLDIVTLKYAPDGRRLWARRFESLQSGMDSASALAVDPIGNVFVAGGSVGLTYGRDLLVLAYSSSGDLKWVRRYDAQVGGTDNATDVAVDRTGNVYVTGVSQGVGGSLDIVTLSYDRFGDLRWVQRFDGPASGDDMPSAMALDGSGHVLVCGTASVPGSGSDFVTLRYDSAGNGIWVRLFDGSAHGVDQASALAPDGQCNVLVTGGSEETAGSGRFRTTTVKYDASGNLLWAQRSGVPLATGFGRGLAVDGGGYVHVTGGDGLGFELRTAKIAPWGDLVWERRYDKQAAAGKIAVDADSNVFVAGWVSEGLDTGLDSLVLSYDAAGNQRWSEIYGGPLAGSPGNYWVSLAVGPTGTVFVTGPSQRGLYGGTDLTTLAYEPTCVVSIQAHCTAKVSSLGCLPRISLANAPSATKGWGSTIRVTGLAQQQPALFFHSTAGAQSRPFHGGFLCAIPPLRRHAPGSTGAPGPPCSGSLSEDLNAYIAAGADPLLVPGATIHLQAWARDPGDPWLDSLSDAVSAVICP